MDQLERVSLYFDKNIIYDINQFKSNPKFIFNNCKDQWINKSEEQKNNSLSSSDINTTELTYNNFIYDVPTLEGLRSVNNSCFTCGVSWHDHHISLDCIECGGYAMQRPCPECNGKCESNWTRNCKVSHEKRKAIWEGKCFLSAKFNENVTSKLLFF